MLGLSVGKILIIIRVGTSKNKNTDHRVKETQPIVSIFYCNSRLKTTLEEL